MKLKLLLFLLVVLFIQSGIFACGSITQRAYGGDLSYSVNPNNPLNCSITVTLYFDIPDSIPTDSIFVDWGDNYTGAIYAASITADSLPHNVNGTSVLYKHVYTGNHTYAAVPPSGYYTISPVFQYRLSGVSNVVNGEAADLNFYITATVAIDTAAGFTNASPVLSPTSIGFGYVNSAFNQPSSYSGANGDSVVFNLQTPLVNDNVQAPAYVFPNDFCAQLGESSNLSINRSTGEISWTFPCSQGIFALSRVVKNYRNGRLLGSVTTDQNIFVSFSATGIQEVSAQEIVKVYPNPASSQLTVEAAQPTRFIISDMLGKIVLSENVSSKTMIDISSLGNGVYFVRNSEHSFITKFVKQ